MPLLPSLSCPCYFLSSRDQSATTAQESQAPSHWSAELDMTCHLPFRSCLEGWNQPRKAGGCQDMRADYSGGSNTGLPTQSLVLAFWLNWAWKSAPSEVRLFLDASMLMLAPVNPHTVTSYMYSDPTVREFGSLHVSAVVNPHSSIVGSLHAHKCALFVFL